MGMWDEMCVACGGPLFAPDKECFDTEGLSETEAKYIDSLSFEDSKWLDDRVGITESEERVPLGQETGYGSFDLDESTYFCAATVFKHMTPSDEGYIYGLTCHTKCLELLERDLHYTLRFQDVWPMLMRQEHGTVLECTDYGGMADYIDQFFTPQAVYLDGKGWMLQDPTANRENGERIVKVWRSIIQSGFQAKVEDGSQARNESAPAAPEIAMYSVEEHEADELINQLIPTEVFTKP